MFQTSLYTTECIFPTLTRANCSCCSAKDKMILEDSYKNNAKPDKQARLDIVNRVSLSEKEVQVRGYCLIPKYFNYTTIPYKTRLVNTSRTPL